MPRRAELRRLVPVTVAPRGADVPRLIPEGRFDARILRGLSALSRRAPHEPAWSAAWIAGALQALPAADVDELLRACALVLAGTAGGPDLGSASRIDAAVALVECACGADAAEAQDGEGGRTFLTAYVATRFLRTAPPDGLAARLEKAVASRLTTALERRAPETPVESAAALIALLDLRLAGAESHRLAQSVLEAQEPSGLWPADGLDGVWGADSVEGARSVATAIGLEALYRYSRAGAVLFKPPRVRTAILPRAFVKPRPDGLDGMLEQASPCLPPALLSGEAQAHLRAAARAVPAELVSGFGLECRLGEEAPRADLAVLLQRHGRRILAGLDPRLALPRALLDHGVWRRVAALCRECEDTTSLAHRHVDGIWLEFDVDGPPAAVPTPSVFVNFSDPAGPSALRRAHEHRRLVETTVGILWDRAVPAAVSERLDECYRLLAGRGEIFAVGVMLARVCDAVRITVKNVPPGEVPGLLADARWPGERSLVAHWLEALAPRTDRIFLDLDVGAQLLPTLGLECKFTRPAVDEPRWSDLLVFLEQQGLCRPEKRQGLLSWPGPFYCEGRLEGESWMCGFDNVVAHLKLAIGPTGRVQAKAYFGAWCGYSGCFDGVGERAAAGR
jgi:hypothetical protein